MKEIAGEFYFRRIGPSVNLRDFSEINTKR